MDLINQSVSLTALDFYDDINIARCILTPRVTHILHCSSPFLLLNYSRSGTHCTYQYFDPLAIKRLVIVLTFVSIFSNY